MIVFLFGGRAAEEVVFGDLNTGAGNDIERATDIARKMVCEWGMSETLGHLSYEKSENPVFLGMSYGNNKSSNYSDARAEQIDHEVFQIIDTGYKHAVKIIKDNREALERLAQGLIEMETLDAGEIDMLVKGAAVSEVQKTRQNKSHGGGLTTTSSDSKKDPKSGSDPVGNPGPVTT